MASRAVLPAGWHWTTIDEVKSREPRAIVSGPFGSSIGRRFFREIGVPVIRGNNLTTDATQFVDEGFVFLSEEKAAEFPNCKALPGDLVFTAAGTLGQVGLIPEATSFDYYIISNKQLRARLDTTIIEPRYAFYWFSSPQMVRYVQQRNTGSTVPLINLSVLRSLPLPLPSIQEQRAITSVLGALDDRIALNSRMSRTLDETAQGIFKSWFVDFDPVKAKTEGRPTGLADQLAALFPVGFTESDLGPIPCGWHVGGLHEVLDVAYGAAFKSAQFNTAGRGSGVIRIRDISSGSTSVFTEEVHPRATVIAPGDVVVGMDGEFRVEPWRGSRALMNQRVCCLRPKPGVSRSFAASAARGPISFFETAKSGTTVVHLGKADIDRVRIVVPSQPVLDAFNSLADPMLERRLVCERESRVLSALRDALLPRLLSGQIRAAEADSIVGEAV